MAAKYVLCGAEKRSKNSLVLGLASSEKERGEGKLKWKLVNISKEAWKHLALAAARRKGNKRLVGELLVSRPRVNPNPSEPCSAERILCVN